MSLFYFSDINVFSIYYAHWEYMTASRQGQL